MATDTISKPVPNSSYDVARRNLEDTDKLVNNTSGAVTNRSGKTMRPLPVLVDELESLIAGNGTRIIQVPSIDVLRTLQGEFDGQVVYLVSYYAGLNKGFGNFKWDAASTVADDGGVTIAVAGVATGRWVRQLDGYVTPEMFGARGDGVSDDHNAIISALAYQRSNPSNASCVKLLNTIYATSNEIIIDNGNKLIGSGAFWKRRTGYLSSVAPCSVIKWIGLNAAQTCVVRVSRKAVGQIATTVTPPNGDDLVNFEVRDFHVDANNSARYGFYMYRCGNSSSVANLTAEKSRLRNFLIMGVYAGRWGHFGSYECESHGLGVGEDPFGWNSAESTCFALHASFHTANNGTNQTYVKNTATDLAESGGIFRCGRGSEITITSESNFGRACLLYQYEIGGGSGGTSTYILDYIEGNADGAYIEYRPSTDGFVVKDGFIHPGNGVSLLPQDFKVVSANSSGTPTADEGPVDNRDWLTFSNLKGNLSGSGFAINSNSYKYKVIDCDPGVTYPDKKPLSVGMFVNAFFKADAGLTDTRYVKGASLTRLGTGQYRLTFLDAQPNSEYSCSVTFLGNPTGFDVALSTKSSTLVQVNTYSGGVLADTGLFIDFSAARKNINT